MALYLAYVVSPAIVYLLMIIVYRKPIFHDKRLKKAFLIVCGIIMFLMIGLRSPDIGSGDTKFYYENWKQMSDVNAKNIKLAIESLDMEWGYVLSVWVFSHIFPAPQMLLVISAAFFAWTVCRFVGKNSKNPLLSLIVFNSLGTFNFMIQGLRQAIAMCICVWAIDQCEKKHFVKFALMIVLACFFHASAIVFAIVWILSKLKMNSKDLLFFGGCAVMAVIFLPVIFEIIDAIIKDTYAIGTPAKSGGFVAVLIYIVIIAFSFLVGRNSVSDYSTYIYMTFVVLTMFVMRNTVSGVAERVGYYFAFGSMIVLPNSIDSVVDERQKALYNFFAVILCFGVAVYKASYSVIIPYYLFWVN